MYLAKLLVIAFACYWRCRITDEARGLVFVLVLYLSFYSDRINDILFIVRKTQRGIDGVMMLTMFKYKSHDTGGFCEEQSSFCASVLSCLYSGITVLVSDIVPATYTVQQKLKVKVRT